MTRDKMIELLINNDFEIDQKNNDYLYLILLEGFLGYKNMTNEQLINELKERELI